MPLPVNGTAWPPKELAPIRTQQDVWDAWYVGTPDRLTAAYRTAQRDDRASTTRRAQYSGGVVGSLARFWWGRPDTGLAQRRDQTHVPIAADLCRASADLLYAEPPVVTTDSDDEATKNRLGEYVDDALATTLAAGAELGAALGGRYHRVTWDAQLTDRPFLTTVDADAAWPEFRWGRLVAATFWHVVARSGATVWRHLERHELDAQGFGLVFHALYEGTGDNLGRVVPLTEHPATAALADLVAADGALAAGRTPGLCVAYVPNQTPQRRWRDHPVGRSLGRSDLDGVEGLMDNLDETWSSLMRDIRLAKARLIVPGEYLRDNGPGKGASFDLDAEVYEAVHAPLGDVDSSGLAVTAQQFAIRVDEHLRTADSLVSRIIQSAGYAGATFGEDGGDGGAMTATEVHARERASFQTRDRKIRLERPAVQQLMGKMLSIDASVFGTALDTSAHVTVAFPDSVQDSVLTLAQTAQTLDAGRAASTEVKVQLVHPDWGKEQVDEEVARIVAEQAVASPDVVPTF
jgi:A118 family predicted phage portal protein